MTIDIDPEIAAMRNHSWRACGLAALLGVLLMPPPARPAGGELNVLDLARGALVERAEASAGGEFDARWLLVDGAEHGWASADGSTGPFEIVISLPVRTEIRRLGFSTGHAETPARAARDVDILISDASADAGFTPLATAALAPETDGQIVTPAHPGTGRWLKLVVRANHGDPDVTELPGVAAFGQPLAVAPPARVTGTYDSPIYGRMALRQDGDHVRGCYGVHDGTVEGRVEGGVLRLGWHERDDLSGTAILVVTRDGTGLTGIWREGDASDWRLGWDLTRTSTDSAACPLTPLPD